MGQADDMEERRRVGRALQAQLPKPRYTPRPRPRVDAAGEVAEVGCLFADGGPLGLAAITLAGILWLFRRRRERRHY